MYMEKKFFMIVFAAMMAMAAFTACGDDDASRTMSGGEMLKNISMDGAKDTLVRSGRKRDDAAVVWEFDRARLAVPRVGNQAFA